VGNIHQTLISLQSKMEKLVHLHRKQKDELLKLKQENEELSQLVDNKEKELLDLKNKNKLMRLGNELRGDERNTDLKYKINELVREIDKSIALLNK
jgi:hypothetical protein